MTKVQLLLDLKDFTKEVLKHETLPVREQKEDNGIAPKDRAPEVHLMRMPDVPSYEKRAPYVLHQIVTGHDGVNSGRRTGKEQPNDGGGCGPVCVLRV